MVQEKKIKDFTDLNAWKKEAHRLAIDTYSLTRRFPKEELFGLTSQMRRAAVSVTSNVAEGFERRSYKEKVQFFYHAQGSLTELKNQSLLSRDISYIDAEMYASYSQQAGIAHQLLQGLITKSKSFISGS